MDTKAKDFSPTGVKLEGAYENDRNADNSPTFKAIIREAFGVQDVIIGHHLIYETRDKRPDGFTYDIVEEIPSADALIFDHDIARKIWGENFIPILQAFAALPIVERDAELVRRYNARAR